MSHLVLARKYRPLAFDSVTSQEHVTRTLRHCIERDKVPHAILFTGPRGVGKTSIARIFAKCLNCAEGVTTTPCLECTNCQEISQSISMAVREIDGASHNSVDNVRELIDSFRMLPAPGSQYKVYIIDEVHMLSTSAFNALLKSLEEPPPHTVFILATTEVHKIPDTVLSRCQRHDLRAIPINGIENRLSGICVEEHVSVEKGVLSIVAQLAEGSMRDAQTILERLFVYAKKGEVKLSDAAELFGFADRQAMFSLSSAIIQRNPKEAISILESIFQTGADSTTIMRDFVSHFRELLVAKIGGESVTRDHNAIDSQVTQLLSQANSLTLEEIQDFCVISRDGVDAALKSTFPKYGFEAVVIRMSTRLKALEISELVNAMKDLAPGLGKINKQQPTLTTTLREAPKTQSAKVGESEAALDWRQFVLSCQKSTLMLAEQLKRMKPIRFEKGILHISGPDFSASYLEKKENKQKLQDCLMGFTNLDSWKISIDIVDVKSGVIAGSIAHNEEAKLKAEKDLKEGEILNSSDIKAIQNLFPGSEIAVKLK